LFKGMILLSIQFLKNWLLDEWLEEEQALRLLVRYAKLGY